MIFQVRHPEGRQEPAFSPGSPGARGFFARAGVIISGRVVLRDLAFPFMDQNSYVYMMGSASRRALYTEVTAHLRKRAFEHKSDLIEGFTRKYKCHRLVYFEIFITEAIAREKEIKG